LQILFIEEALVCHATSIVTSPTGYQLKYEVKLLMAKKFLTHKEYTRGGWKKWAH